MLPTSSTAIGKADKLLGVASKNFPNALGSHQRLPTHARI